MENKDLISQELRELGSSLTGRTGVNLYQVPEGYFEMLPTWTLSRIKALGAQNSVEETFLLSSVVGGLPKKIPYVLPAGYFENLLANIIEKIRASELPAHEEIASLSPLLSGLKNRSTYAVPDGYFASLERKKEETKVISILHRPWFRAAAAAVVAGIFILAGFLFYDKGPSAKTPIARVSKEIRKMNDSQKDELMDLMDMGLSGKETVKTSVPAKTKEIRRLLQDIPQQELEELEQQTEDIQDVLMTN
jgi:hypothetical protein